MLYQIYELNFGWYVSETFLEFPNGGILDILIHVVHVRVCGFFVEMAFFKSVASFLLFWPVSYLKDHPGHLLMTVNICICHSLFEFSMMVAQAVPL